MKTLSFIITIAGFVLMLIPVGETGIINLNMQFIGMALAICGAIFYVGFLLDERIAGQSQLTPTASQKAADPEDSNANYILASEYAEQRGMSTDEVINSVSGGTLAGKPINGKWHVAV